MNTSSLSIRLLAVCLALAITSNYAFADVLALYSFGSTSDSLATSDVDANSVASSLTAVVSGGNSGFSTFATITNGGSAQASPRTYYIDSNATPNSSGSANDYLQFTLTLNAGFTASLTNISFDHAATGTVTSNWEVRYSLDGFATAGNILGTSTKSGTVGHDYIHFSQSIAEPALQSVGASATTVTFRIYAYDDVNGAAINRIDNITLEGAVIAIPEPSTYAAAFGLMAVGLAATRRRVRVG